jgi:hypothetical protein
VQKRSIKKKRGLDLAKPVERPRLPASVGLRMFLLGGVAIGASGYAIWRHYAVPRPSMLRVVSPDEAPAAPPEPSSSDWRAAPELVPLPPDRDR